MNDKIKLSGVFETMLQTVYARAKESAGRGAIRDKKAEEIIGNLDYDFLSRIRMPQCTAELSPVQSCLTA